MLQESIQDYYTIQPREDRQVERFGGRISDYRIVIEPLNLLLSRHPAYDVVSALFESIIRRVTRGFDDSDRVGFVISSPNLRQDVGIPLTRLDQLSVERIWALIEQILQSNEEFWLLGGFEIRVVHIRMPQGGKSNENTIPLERFIKNKKRFISIQNKDNLCLGRALVVAIAHTNKDTDPDTYQRIRSDRYTTQSQKADELYEAARVDKSRKGGLPEIKQFQEHLQDKGYQIAVFINNTSHGLIYKGPPNDKLLTVFLHDGHYDVIVAMPAFLRKSYFCTTCLKGYDQASKHNCIDTCSCCRSQRGCKVEGWVVCRDCGRCFKSAQCLENHKVSLQTEKGKSVCQLLRKCKDCNRLLDGRREDPSKHQCNKVYCERCKALVDRDEHQCYMRPLPDPAKQKAQKNKKSKETPKQKFIFFDFECRQDEAVDTNMHGSVFKHIPNLCVATRVCEDCHKNTEDVCKNCGVREHIFRGDDTIDKFCEWLFGTEEDHKGSIAVAHNARSYDAQFIQEYCHRHGIVPDVILNGAKILSLSVMDVKVIDSLSFLAMPLSSFPSTFGLQELKKGFFPHLFNTSNNQNYKGPLPNKKYYDPDGMSESKRVEFEAWYTQHQNDQFDFANEILLYCRSDVQILMEGCMAFRTLFMDITKGIDPFQNITIASACNTVFRTRFLKPNTIGLIPTQGYRSRDRHSIIALKWLEWLNQQDGARITHARNGGEHRIGNYRVDGFDFNTHTVYEFLGDLWHGCPKCYKRRDVLLPGSAETVQEVYDSTMYRLNALRRQGYMVVQIWECEFRKKIEDDPRVKAFIDTLQFEEPLEPRDAFYGGRTNAIKLYHRIQGNEQMKYVDVCSLYPWVCKYAEFPLGHPVVITDNFDDLNNYFGLIKCKVYPPRALFHPVLPYRSEESKLLFPLCRTCADLKSTSLCMHTEEERALSHTWVTEEVKKALELGYELVDIYEVWHYPRSTKYNPETREGGLFTEYIDLFLKVKQESSGWPSNCVSETENVDPVTRRARESYIESYHEKEGVCLDATKIKKNNGLRAVSKICLNSFWGKFGQRNNLTKTEYFAEPESFFGIISNPTLEVKNVDFPHEFLAQVQYVHADDYLEVLPNTNVVIAAFTTCHARLKLYSYMEKLQTKTLYTDTDSIIYLKDDSVDDIPTGNFLGDMTDELEKDYGVGSYITELVALGPKNYSYKVFSTKQNEEVVGACKVRGITLNYRNTQLVNFDSCKELIRGVRSRTTVTNPHRIVRAKNMGVVTRTETKVHRMVYDKRVKLNEFDTVPYGF